MSVSNGYAITASGKVEFAPVDLEIENVAPLPVLDHPGSAMIVGEYGRGTVRHTIAGYAAYGDKAGWKTWDNKPMPQWEELGIAIQRRWCEAAMAIIGSEKGE